MKFLSLKPGLDSTCVLMIVSVLVFVLWCLVFSLFFLVVLQWTRKILSLGEFDVEHL